MIIEHKGKFSTDEILALTILKVFNKGKIYIQDDTKDFYNIDFINNEISSTVEEIFKSRGHKSSRMSDALWKHLGKQFLKEADYPEDLWNTLYKRIILPSYDEFPSFGVRHLEQMTNYTEILYDRTSMFSASFKYVLQSCVDWFEYALKDFAKEYSLIEYTDTVFQNTTKEYVVLPSRFGWAECYEKYPNVKLVVFENSVDWCVRTMPISSTDSTMRCLAPKEWEDRKEFRVNGIFVCFCSSNRVFARTLTMKDAIALAEIWLSTYKQ